MNSKTLVRLVLAALIFLIFDVVLCIAIFIPQRGAVTPSPTQRIATQIPTTPSATSTVIPPQATSTIAPATATRPPVSPTPGVLTSIADLETAINAGRHLVPFRVTLTEQQITDEITSYLNSSGDSTFSDVAVSLQPGVAVITGKVRVLGFSVAAKATATVVLVDGRPRLKVLQLDALGGLIPGAIKDRIIQMIEQQTDLPLLGDLPVTIDKVEIQTGQVVVTGQTK